MKCSQYKPNQITGNISKLIFFALSVTATTMSIAEIKDENPGTTHAWTPDAYLSVKPDNNYINLSFGNNINIYNGESTDLVLFIAGNATKFKDNHVGISVSLSW